MKICPVTDAAFAPYGRVLTGYESETAALVALLNSTTPLPKDVEYQAEDSSLQNSEAAHTIQTSLYGGMPVQFGWCNGHNTKLNCLEYHRDSEFNLGSEDFILLLAKQDEIVNGKLDTSKVKAFRVPAGILVEVYATTLHYAPCHSDSNRGFKVMVALPRGTNTTKPAMLARGGDDVYLWACNKWLLAHPDSVEAAQGAKAALTGTNIDIAMDL